MKRSKSRLNSSSENRLFKNKQYLDIERCQDELFRMKIQYNKLNQEYLELKVEYNKLEREYKYNVKLMEAIIKEANISVVSEFLGDENNNENNTDNNNNNDIKKSNLSKNTLKILKEKSIYERLKIEIMNLRDELRQKENIINELKNNTKTSKFKEMDTKIAQIYQELSETKNRNEFLENMQKDYINSKNQIIFLLQQIDLYKKDNKRQKEKIERLVFTTQNTIMQKEENDNQKTLEENKIKMLKNDNDKLKRRIKDMESKNFAYYEEMEKLKNQKQNQTDKYMNKKDNEIRRYKAQIVELKMEISKLQKQLDEKNNINNNIIIKKPINRNPNNNNNPNNIGGEKSLRKTESDFFLTSQKIVLNDNNKKINNNYEKIIINSKDATDENKIEKKQKSVKINNKPLNSINNNYIKVNDKNINKNNFYNIDPNAIVIKGGQNLDNFSEEKNSEINEEQKIDENKEEDEKEKSKDINREKDKNELSKVDETEKENIKEDDKKDEEEKYEVNDDNILIDIKTVEDGKDNEKLKEKEQNDKEKEKYENKIDEEKSNEDKIYKEEKRSETNKGKESSRTSELFKEMNNENYENKNEKGEYKISHNESEPPTTYDKKKKFNEDEIVNDFSKDENINKQKYQESMDEYNDFENNFSKSNEFEKNSNIKNEKNKSKNNEETNRNNNNDNDDFLI